MNDDDYLEDPDYCGNGGKWHPDSTKVGGCDEGCCDDYKCNDCGKEFRVEWPD